VAGTFLLDIRLGIATWLAAAAHEVPQELGDFAALVHGGWTTRRALRANFLSALMFPVGALLTYAVSFHMNTDFLIAFGAGNFLYIGAADPVPEVNRSRTAADISGTSQPSQQAWGFCWRSAWPWKNRGRVRVAWKEQSVRRTGLACQPPEGEISPGAPRPGPPSPQRARQTPKQNLATSLGSTPLALLRCVGWDSRRGRLSGRCPWGR
jgi:hypothetical protein